MLQLRSAISREDLHYNFSDIDEYAIAPLLRRGLLQCIPIRSYIQPDYISFLGDCRLVYWRTLLLYLTARVVLINILSY